MRKKLVVIASKSSKSSCALGKGSKKGGWVGSAVDRFSVIFFFFEKNMSLKHWILSKDHFKTHLCFSIFGWGDPSQLGSWSEGCVKPLKLSREAI